MIALLVRIAIAWLGAAVLTAVAFGLVVRRRPARPADRAARTPTPTTPFPVVGRVSHGISSAVYVGARRAGGIR